MSGHIECQCDQCVMDREFDRDNPRPWRCGAFVAETGEQCVLESDHAYRHIMPSDLIENHRCTNTPMLCRIGLHQWGAWYYASKQEEEMYVIMRHDCQRCGKKAWEWC